LYMGVDVRGCCVIETRYRCINMTEKPLLHDERGDKLTKHSKGCSSEPRTLYFSISLSRNESLPKRDIAASRVRLLLCILHSWTCVEDDIREWW
jgi:hypothetical protein